MAGPGTCEPGEALSPGFGSSLLQAERSVRNFVHGFHVSFEDDAANHRSAAATQEKLLLLARSQREFRPGTATVN